MFSSSSILGILESVVNQLNNKIKNINQYNSTIVPVPATKDPLAIPYALVIERFCPRESSKDDNPENFEARADGQLVL